MNCHDLSLSVTEALVRSHVAHCGAARSSSASHAFSITISREAGALATASPQGRQALSSPATTARSSTDRGGNPPGTGRLEPWTAARLLAG